MAVPVKITGLDAFDLTRSAFVRLRSRRVVAHLNLATYQVTRDVTRRPPELRHAYLRDRVAKWLLRLRRDFPDVHFQPNRPDPARRRWSALPTGIVVRTTAGRVTALAKARGVYVVHVSAIEGLRRRAKRRPTKAWYCVRARVVITVEGQVSGMQTIEDRFVIVRASSHKDATARLAPHWREYAKPYLNSSGNAVRWQLDEIVDVYWITEDTMDPAGTEVYSRLGRRRLPRRSKSG